MTHPSILRYRPGLGHHPGPRVRPRRSQWWVPQHEVGAEGLPRPEAGGDPVVGITMDTRAEGPLGAEFTLDAVLVDAVRLAGGVPWLLPPGAGSELLGQVDALLIPGGAFDIHPRHYGEAVQARLDEVKEDRTALELAVARHALGAGLPVLGLCGGMQVLNVAAGGSLIQDLPAAPTHEQPTDPGEAWHPVALRGRLAELLGPTLPVNSTHHQAVRCLGAGFVAEGVSPDGVVEAITHQHHPFAVGVQWHPERLGDARLFLALVRAARAQP